MKIGVTKVDGKKKLVIIEKEVKFKAEMKISEIFQLGVKDCSQTFTLTSTDGKYVHGKIKETYTF